ncbi:hypothetical protein [Phormidium sp. CCY1219]|uniref:hypothetical protein n=1 Tax=Phormidium sp. CCY1219 TaxID=2886104 RepID=UPI002D1E880F|nr:hypothetical protein [Phormidium sp. CCY1219]MEB3827035.1 hypothetical protein [Phormidium sp. CCY1219]
MAIITDYHHWEYFLSLENNLINLSRYIEFRGVDNPTSINACAYSIELTKIFLAACAECENILKILAPCPPSITKEKYNIKKIKINLEDNFSPIFNQLVDTNIYLPTYNICFNPWQHWKTQDSPPRWWSAHNRIKHNRTQPGQ